jgi:carbon storage regulator CsrA
MLVLSRRPEEKIVLPTVPAVIKVVSAQAGVVRLGIDAPEDVPILREELCSPERAALLRARSRPTAAPAVELGHSVRNRVNNLLLGLALLRLRFAEVADVVVHKTLEGLEEEAEALRRLVDGLAKPCIAGPAPLAGPAAG